MYDVSWTTLGQGAYTSSLELLLSTLQAYSLPWARSGCLQTAFLPETTTAPLDLSHRSAIVPPCDIALYMISLYGVMNEKAGNIATGK